MQQSDHLEGIARNGAMACRRGMDFHSNPHYRANGPDLLEWYAVAMAWATGWLDADAGRDQEIAAPIGAPIC